MGVSQIPVTFIKNLSANSEQNFEAFFDHAMRIKQIYVWFPKGCENKLSHRLTANETNLFKTIDQETLVGDDTKLDFPVDLRFDRDMMIKLRSINTDDWEHTVFIILIVEVLCN